jgi:hypothetical protein
MGKMADETGSPLRIVVSAIPGVVYTKSNIPLRVTFENIGRQKMRILRHFDPLPVFFAFDMVGEDGTHVAIPGAGKIDFYEGSIEYATLPAGGTLNVDVNLASVLARPELVKPGKYTISVTYHNQYGEDCFRGMVSSGPASVTLLPEPQVRPK